MNQLRCRVNLVQCKRMSLSIPLSGQNRKMAKHKGTQYQTKGLTYQQVSKYRNYQNKISVLFFQSLMVNHPDLEVYIFSF